MERDDEDGEKLVEQAEGLLDVIQKKIRQLRERLGIPHHESDRRSGVDRDKRDDSTDGKNRIVAGTIAPAKRQGLVTLANQGHSAAAGHSQGRVENPDGPAPGDDVAGSATSDRESGRTENRPPKRLIESH